MISPSTILRLYFVAFLLLVLFNVNVDAEGSVVGSVYELDTEYSGDNFFDGFDFFTLSDPTNGFVNYVSGAEATALNLISVSTGGVYMGVDSVTMLNPNGTVGRNSVRITSQKSWTHGLFISDINHMPGGICGTWPAHWTLGPDWPNNGEIDIIEGVNSQQDNLMSLHTSADCTITGDLQLGTLQTSDCDVYYNNNAGCGTTANADTSYGSDFNSGTGGVYATQWTSDYIRIWFFARGSIPQNILDGAPDPSYWGEPQANFQGLDDSCNIDTHFADHQIIFDTTFCGDLGNQLWASDSVCRQLAPTCNDYVARNPSVYANAYWSINSVKVYQLVASSPSSSTDQVHFSEPSAPAPSGTQGFVTPASSVLYPGMGGVVSSSPTAVTTLAIPSIGASGPDPFTISTFVYLGCLSSPSGFSFFEKIAVSTAMTPQLCVASCPSYAYAGIYSTQCYCGDELEVGVSNNNTCTISCPGNTAEICGGMITSVGSGNFTSGSAISRFKKRQSVALDLLLTVYENVDLIGSNDLATVTVTISPGPNFTAPPTVSGGVHFIPAPGSALIPTISIEPAFQVFGLGMGGNAGPDEFFTTVLSTTYVDVCPDGSLTTLTTTATITTCSCQGQNPTAAPAIPMATTTKTCAACGAGGSPAVVTVTVPYVEGFPTAVATNASNASNASVAVVTVVVIPLSPAEMSSYIAASQTGVVEYTGGAAEKKVMSFAVAAFLVVGGVMAAVMRV